MNETENLFRTKRSADRIQSEANKDKLTVKTINTRFTSQETLGKEGRKTGN